MAATPAQPRIDWHQLWYPGRRTPFTPEEMASAGADAPSPTMLVVVGVNLITMALAVLVLAPAEQRAMLGSVMAGLCVLGGLAARWLWWRPWRQPLMLASCAVGLMVGMVAGFLRQTLPAGGQRATLALTLSTGCMLLVALLWMLTVWRAHQIDGRLAAQAEREKAIEMARRLAAAQLEPHFLFNTLASVQHWVQTKDDRAAPLLAALTGYLRSTLPLFNRPLLAAGDELSVVQQHLQVMQLRMGERLSWQLDVPADLHHALLPPGVLLTLVENALVHGLEPQLHGGQLRITGRREGGHAIFEVLDNGPGPAPDMADGVGLTNIRERLLLACGPTASLDITPADAGGCRARLQLPFKTTP